MKLKVDRISDKGLELEEDVSTSSWDLDSSDIKFKDGLHLNCKISRRAKEIIVEADVVFQKDITCSRCLNRVSQGAKHKFQKSYYVDEVGEYLEPDEDIREDILLNFPMKVLCKSGCKGACSNCGVNLNLSQCICQGGLKE